MATLLEDGRQLAIEACGQPSDAWAHDRRVLALADAATNTMHRAIEAIMVPPTFGPAADRRPKTRARKALAPVCLGIHAWRRRVRSAKLRKNGTGTSRIPGSIPMRTEATCSKKCVRSHSVFSATA